jgi:SAM-dependent methyltransferase
VKPSRLKEDWNRLAESDPLWAILTDPAKRCGGWDAGEFFATGVREIADAMETARGFGYPAECHTALDFGCGVGRLTQALAGFFDRVTGVDISPVMIELARQYNRHGDRCAYLLNAANHLRQFPDASFDFIYSRIVLQHVGARNALGYVREFARVLRPSGLALFQLPSRLRSPSALSRFGYRINRVRGQLLSNPGFMYMCGVPREKVIGEVEKAGARVIHVLEDYSARPEWESWVYAVTR